ncbi:MAG: hypothetical protein LBJ03_02845 [Holosporales bacterium]|nr:hypothetical protein [Holosporales bacterium]
MSRAKLVIHHRLAGFDAESSDTWERLRRHYGNASSRELFSIGCVIAQMAQIPSPDRNCRRSKAVLVKWFYENGGVVEPFLDSVKLIDRDNHDIDRSDTWERLRQHYGNASSRELFSIGCVIAQMAQIPHPDRNCRRSKAVLVKWFYENWDKINPWMFNEPLATAE